MWNSKLALALCLIGVFVLGGIVTFACDRLLFKRVDARDGMQTVAMMQDWRISCPPRTVQDGTCVLQTGVIDKSTNAALAELTVSKKGQGDMLAIVMPLGVLLPPGLRFSAGADQARPVAFKTCLQGGCVAVLPLDSELSTAMTQNAGGQIVVLNNRGKAVALNYSLRGFSDAVAARAADTAARKPGWW